MEAETVTEQDNELSKVSGEMKAVERCPTSLELEGKDHDETLTDDGGLHSSVTELALGHALWCIPCVSGRCSLDLSSSFAGDKKDFSLLI